MERGGCLVIIKCPSPDLGEGRVRGWWELIKLNNSVFKDMKKINKRGFTLIELLVVIAIIGLLSTIALNSLDRARMGARDAKRLSDLKNIQKALEMYMSANNGHLPTGTVSNFTSQLAEYLPEGVPHNPFYGAIRYYWICTTGNTYVLLADMEKDIYTQASKQVNTSFDSLPGCYYFRYVSPTGKSNALYTLPRSINCSLNNTYCFSGTFTP